VIGLSVNFVNYFQLQFKLVIGFNCGRCAMVQEETDNAV